MLAADELYQPTLFWREASANMVKEIAEEGVENFRRLKGPLGYFVPTYGSPGNGFSEQQVDELSSLIKERYPGALKPILALDSYLNGEAEALANYRVFMAGDQTDKAPNLQAFSESSFGSPKEQFEFEGRAYSRSSLNYLLGLVLLKRHLDGELPTKVLEIGGGFGSLGEILAKSEIKDLRYIDVDIPPTGFVAEQYLRAALGQSAVATYASTADSAVIDIDSLPTATTLCAWQIERLQGEVDLFVNFISFQEMEPSVVRNYLSHVERLKAKWVLLRNLREGKQKWREGSFGVMEPILGDDYAEMLPNYDLIDRNVLPFGYRTVDNFHSELLLFRRNA